MTSIVNEIAVGNTRQIEMNLMPNVVYTNSSSYAQFKFGGVLESGITKHLQYALIWSHVPPKETPFTKEGNSERRVSHEPNSNLQWWCTQSRIIPFRHALIYDHACLLKEAQFPKAHIYIHWKFIWNQDCVYTDFRFPFSLFTRKQKDAFLSPNLNVFV